MIADEKSLSALSSRDAHCAKNLSPKSPPIDRPAMTAFGQQKGFFRRNLRTPGRLSERQSGLAVLPFFLSSEVFRRDRCRRASRRQSRAARRRSARPGVPSATERAVVVGHSEAGENPFPGRESRGRVASRSPPPPPLPLFGVANPVRSGGLSRARLPDGPRATEAW